MKRLLLLAAFLVVVPLQAQEKLRVENDLVFGKGGGQELRLDLAVPAGPGPFPAILCVHGGGWRGGSRKLFAETLKVLAGRGYVAAAVEYRLAPDHKFPAQIEDCKCEVRWLRANAAKYKVDPNRIGAVGFSAGGHLVCLLGLTTRADGLEGTGDLTPDAARQSSRVQAVVSFFGPTDFTREDWDPKVQPLITDFLGGTLKEKPAVYAKASPVTYVRPDKDNPPFLIFHGTQDDIVRYSHAVLLVKKLHEVKAPAELVTMEGEGHGWKGEKLQESVAKTILFFDRHLKQESP